MITLATLIATTLSTQSTTLNPLNQFQIVPLSLQRSNRICSVDSDCSPPYITCQKEKCLRKHLFPLTLSEVIGAVLQNVLTMLASTVGVGGGAFIVPIMIYLFEFDLKHSAILSNGLILCGSFVAYGFAFHNKHPQIDHRTLIDYNLAIIMLPAMMIGSVIGTTISSSFSTSLKFIVLALLLLLSCAKTLQKAIKTWKSESAKIMEGEMDLTEVFKSDLEEENF